MLHSFQCIVSEAVEVRKSSVTHQPREFKLNVVILWLTETRQGRDTHIDAANTASE